MPTPVQESPFLDQFRDPYRPATGEIARFPPPAPEDPAFQRVPFLKSMPGAIRQKVMDAESKRLQAVSDIISGSDKMTVLAYGSESGPLTKGILAELYRRLQGGMDVVIPPTGSIEQAFGQSKDSVAELENMLVGSVPVTFIRFVYGCLRESTPETINYGAEDIFPVDILNKEKIDAEATAEMIGPDQEIVMPGADPHPGKRPVYYDQLRTGLEKTYKTKLCEFLLSKQIATNGMPGLETIAIQPQDSNGRPLRSTNGETLPQTLSEALAAVQSGGGGQRQVAAVSILKQAREAGWRIVNSVRFDDLWHEYADHMREDHRPLLRYAYEIANSLRRRTYTVDQFEAKLDEKARALDCAVAKGQGQTGAGKEITLRASWDGVSQEIENEAKSMYPAGMKKGIVFVDLDDNIAQDFYASSERGLMSERAVNLITKISRQAEALGAGCKIVFLCKIAPRVAGAQGGTVRHSNLQEYNIHGPEPVEFEHIIIPKWMLQLCKTGYSFTRGGQAVMQMAPQKIYNEKEVSTFINRLSKLSTGFSAVNSAKFLNAIKEQAMQSKGSVLMGFQPTKVLAIEDVLKAAEDHAATFLLQGATSAEGHQLKTVFALQKGKPEAIAAPADITALINKYTMTYKIGQNILSRSDFTWDNIATLAKEDGLDFWNDLNIPSEIVDKLEKASPAERETLMPQIRKHIKQHFAMQHNFLLLEGPAGTGKTSIARMIADVLQIPFWKISIATAKDKYVGQTVTNLEAIFSTMKRMHDCVLLLDEVDELFDIYGGGHDPGVTDIQNSFKKHMDEIGDGGIAVKNNTIIVSATNNIELLSGVSKGAIVRRLSDNGTGLHHIGPPTDEKQVEGVVDTLLNRVVGGSLLRASIESAVGPFKAALVREAAKKRAYTPAEILSILKLWFNWNTDILKPAFSRGIWKDMPDKRLFRPEPLVFLVENASRQSKSTGERAGMLDVTSFIGTENHPEGRIPKHLVTGEAAPSKEPIPMKGYRSIKQPISLPQGQPVQPIQQQVPLTEKPVPVPNEETMPPIAKNVNVQDELLRSEENSVSKVPKRTNAAVHRPSIKLMAVADNELDRAHGLKFVRHLPSDQGMLFKFQSPQIMSFWMCETYLPLDIAFIDKNGIVVKADRMVPLSTRSVSSGRPCTMALEVNAGMLEDFGGKVGAKAIIDLDGKTVSFTEADE